MTSSRSPPPGSPRPPLMRGWNPHPFSTHCIGGEMRENTHSVPRSLPRTALVPGLPRGVTARVGSCPRSLQVQPHTSSPPRPPVLAWGTKAAEAAQPEAHKPGRAASGSHRSQTSGGQGRVPGQAPAGHTGPRPALGRGALGLGGLLLLCCFNNNCSLLG